MSAGRPVERMWGGAVRDWSGESVDGLEDEA